MRTTVTLDDDIAKRLERARQQRQQTFKDALNEALRAGLPALECSEPSAEQPQHTRPINLGRQLVDIDNVAEALAIAEKDDFR